MCNQSCFPTRAGGGTRCCFSNQWPLHHSSLCGGGGWRVAGVFTSIQVDVQDIERDHLRSWMPACCTVVFCILHIYVLLSEHTQSCVMQWSFIENHGQLTCGCMWLQKAGQAADCIFLNLKTKIFLKKQITMIQKIQIHKVKITKSQFGDNSYQLHLKWSFCLSLSRYSNPKTTHSSSPSC